MREIKFRAWDKELKEMISGDDYQGSEWIAQALEVLMHGGTDEWTEQIEIMQFTGLHDKKGKEIYEGDIVEWQDDMGDGMKRSFDSSVVFQGGAFYPICTMPGREFEVIGNIYEHRELLKESV